MNAKYSAILATCLFVCGLVISPVKAQNHDQVIKQAFDTKHTLTGRPFRDAEFSPTVQQMLEKDLEIAKTVMKVAPEREESYHWLGRRYGYLGKNAEAIMVFTEGLKRFPNSYELYRYRARHLARNYQFEQSIADYNKAADLMKGKPDIYEPNGIANKLNVSITTFHQNIPYYLGQTSMATGDYETVIREMDKSLAVPVLFAHDDQKAPVAFWKYLALRKLGRHAEAEAVVAAIPAEMDLIENGFYHEGVKYFKGLYDRDEFLKTADVLQKYAVAMVDHFNGDNESAIKLWTEATVASPHGFWPAEAELVKFKDQ